ncbi:MAG: CPBP family intramembrane metalloprotease [Lachnospiraceae bacterium]|nr:CPBP family intramembrane metalloprotease [Lachnospiraceae bacterium]
MDLQLAKPEAVIKAQEKHKGMNWFLEILVFIAVFLVGGIAQILCMLPIEMLLLSQNEMYQTALEAGDVEGATAAAMQIAASDLYMVASLAATIGMTAVTIAFCRFIQKRRLEAIGFTKQRAGKDYLIGFGMGFVLFSAAVLLCVLTGALKIDGFSGTFNIGIFVFFTIGFMLQGMSEEVICRGYLMVSIGRRYSMWVAILSNSLIFASLHLFNNGISVLAFINLALYGIFASLYFIERGNIWGVAAFHSVWNLVQGNFWGLRVSGMTAECSVFRSTLADNRDIINGGAFGPEGGLAVTIVLAVGIVVLLKRIQDRKQDNVDSSVR